MRVGAALPKNYPGPVYFAYKMPYNKWQGSARAVPKISEKAPKIQQISDR